MKKYSTKGILVHLLWVWYSYIGIKTILIFWKKPEEEIQSHYIDFLAPYFFMVFVCFVIYIIYSKSYWGQSSIRSLSGIVSMAIFLVFFSSLIFIPLVLILVGSDILSVQYAKPAAVLIIVSFILLSVWQNYTNRKLQKSS